MQVVFNLISLALVGATAGVHAHELRGGTAVLADVAAAATGKGLDFFPPEEMDEEREDRSQKTSSAQKQERQRQRDEKRQERQRQRDAEAGTPSNLNTAAGRRAQFDRADFVFDLLGSEPVQNDGGTIQTLDVTRLPSLAGQGLSYTLINLEPCGINLPHVHPRATELIYVISGTNLQTAFVEENNGRVILNEIGKGETTFFPLGLIHYQQNLSCEPVSYLAALNNEDPGVVTVTTQFFQFPSEVLQGALGEDAYLVQQLIDGLPGNPAEGDSACRQRCG